MVTVAVCVARAGVFTVSHVMSATAVTTGDVHDMADVSDMSAVA